MPKLALGAGIAQGAKAFTDSFMQAHMYDQQQKLQKHQIIVQALYRQLEDDNIPYAQRARILDSIPSLLGVKMDVPLSQQMGLHDLLDKDVETQSEISSTPAVKGTPASTITDSRATEAGLADTIGQQATQDTPAGIGRPQVAEKFGDLSPAKYKQLIVNRQQDIDSARALEQYRRKAEIDFDLQQQSYKAQGYNKVITEGFNANGEYVVLMANQSNDIKEVKMPKGFQPTKILAKSGTKLPSMVVARTAFYQNEVNPITGKNYTPEEAQQQALTDYKEFGDEMWKANKAAKEASTTGTTLRNTGEMPRTKSEIEADKDRDENRADRQATQLDTQYGILRDADTQLTSISSNLSAAQAAHNQAKSALDAWVISNGEKEGQEGLLSGILGKADRSKQTKINVNGTNYYIDPEDLADDEYKTLNAEVDRTRNEVSRLSSEEAKYRGNRDSAQQRIRNLEARQGAKSGGSNNATITITQAQIDTFRRNNANKPKFRNMKDEEIRQYLIDNVKKWQP
jgi:hypothetical protein